MGRMVRGPICPISCFYKMADVDVKSSKFVKFLEELKLEGILKKISRSAKNLCEERHLSLTALTIDMSDAGVGYGVPFSRATCVTTESLKEFYPFASIFKKGISALSRLLNDFEYVPEGKEEERILETLLMYLTNKDCHDFIIGLRKKPLTNETQLAVALTEHLFSRLTNAGYIIDNDCDELLMCNCGCKKLLSNIKTNTSIGHPAVWHGNLDIIVGNDDVPVKIQDRPNSPGKRTSMEVKKDYTPNEIDSVSTRQQIVSQTIVYSFLQRKRDPDLDSFLIPSIGVSYTEIIFFFFDCENDVLLKSPPMPLHNEDGTLNYELIVALWLVLNYKCFGSGLSDRLLLAPKANFFREAKDYLSVYKDNLTQGNVNSSVPPMRADPTRHPVAKFVKIAEFTFPNFF